MLKVGESATLEIVGKLRSRERVPMSREKELRKLEEDRKRILAKMMDTEVDDTPEGQQRLGERLENFRQITRAERKLRDEIRRRELGMFGPPQDDLTIFEKTLERETGKRRLFDVCDVFDRRQKGSSYYYNKASDLHAGALVLWDACQSPVGFMAPDPKAEQLGLGKGFRLDVALPSVFFLLAGLSIELLLKAIARVLGLENRNSHRTVDLSTNVGILLSHEHAGIAASLTEYVYWASRYPTPSKEDQYQKAQRIFYEAGTITLPRYESLWGMLSAAYWRAKRVIHEP